MADNILTKDRALADLDIAAKEIGGVKFPRNMLVDATGADITPSTETTLAAVLSAANALNSKTTAVNTSSIGGTVELGSTTISSLTSPGLTDTQLRASPLAVTGSFYQATQPVSFTWEGLTDAQLRAAPVTVSLPGVATDQTAQALQELSETMLFMLGAILEKMPRVTGNDQAAVSIEGGTLPTVTTVSTVTNVTTLATLTNMTQVGGRPGLLAADSWNNAGAAYIYNQINVS